MGTQPRGRPESRYFSYEGARIHYHVVGEGPTVVFLHGGGPGATSWSNFSQNVASFAERYRTVLLDQPGYGESELPRLVDGSMRKTCAAVVPALLDELGVESAHLVGNSLGGGTSLRLALDQPERVGRLVLMGPGGGFSIFGVQPTEGIRTLLSFYDPPGPDIDRMHGLVDVMMYDPSLVPAELVESRFAAATEPGATTQIPKVLEEPLWPEIHLVEHETLLIWGRDDRVAPLDAGIYMLRQMRNARLHVFPRCGHWAQLEWADEFDRLALQFLDG